MQAPWYTTAKWRVFFAMGLTYMVVVLSTSLSFLLLSPIAEHFGVSLAAVGWVVIIEGLVVASLLLPIGGLADSFGRRRTLVWGLAVFAAGSVLTGLAPTFVLLIAARLVMSLGNTMAQAVATGLLVAAFPPDERGVAMGAQTSAVAVGSASGPLVGGLLLRSLDWNILFLLLAVPAVAAIVATLAYLPDDRPEGADARFRDYVGAVLSAGAVVVLIVTISNPFEVAFGSMFTMAGAGLFVALVASFVLWELRHPLPMMPLRLFANRPFRTAVLVRFVGFIGSAAISILLPVYLLSVRGVSNTTAGFVLALHAVGIGVSAQFAGRLYDRIGPRWPTVIGFCVQATCTVVLALASTTTAVWAVGALAIGSGFGQSLWNVPNNSAMMGATSRESLGVVGAFTNVARTMGSVIGQAVATAIVAGVMIRSEFDIPLADVNESSGAIAAFADGWSAAFFTAVAVIAVACAIGLRLPHGSPEGGLTERR